jgi:hypothetical protein
MGTGASFPGDKAAGASMWPLNSNQCRGQEYVDLYIHSPILLHDIVLLSTTDNFTFTFWQQPVFNFCDGIGINSEIVN